MNEILEKAATFAYSFKQTVYHTYHMALQMIDIAVEGDFAECGVAAGSQIAAMAVALLERGDKRIIYAFDSFEGIPLAGEFDTEQPGIGEIKHDKFLPINHRLISSRVSSHSIENVKSNFNYLGLPIDNVNFVKGWFQETLPNTKIEKLSLLRLDGDLHESTLVSLQCLYPKVSPGGIVIIDDYALTGCQIAVQQYFRQLPDIIPVEGGGGVVYFIKQ